jgi:hypothetical protein
MTWVPLWGSAEADVAELAGHAQGDGAGLVDAVAADPVVGLGIAAGASVLTPAYCKDLRRSTMAKRKEPTSRAAKAEQTAKVSKTSKGGKSVTRSAVTGKSAALSRSGRFATKRSGTVKVVRNGNGRALPVPAGVLSEVNAGIGSLFEVRAMGDDVLFHRLTGDESEPATIGSGTDRVFAPAEVAFVGSSPGVALLDDWDF